MRNNLDDLLKKAPTCAEYLAIYVDRVEVKCFNGSLSDADGLLELRIFTPDCEARIYRDSVTNDFDMRLLTDDCYPIFNDEEQYLDIAQTEAIDGGILYTTTGGGSFMLPYPEKMQKVKIRRYMKVNKENGLYVFADWRMIRFIGEGE